MKAVKVCLACGAKYGKSKECSMKKIMIDDIGHHRIPYGSSTEGFGPAVGKCMGCGVRPGHTHHWECGFEICPACHQQLISCQCKKEMIEI